MQELCKTIEAGHRALARDVTVVQPVFPCGTGGSMVLSCFAYACTARDTADTRERGIKFYVFPSDEQRRNKWISAIQRADFTPTAHSVLCSQHFAGGIRILKAAITTDN